MEEDFLHRQLLNTYCVPGFGEGQVKQGHDLGTSSLLVHLTGGHSHIVGGQHVGLGMALIQPCDLTVQSCSVLFPLPGELL